MPARDVQGPDAHIVGFLRVRPGTKVGRLGLGVTHARINTEKGAAIDTIYVQDEQGHKLTDKEKLDELAKAVSAAVLTETSA